MTSLKNQINKQLKPTIVFSVFALLISFFIYFKSFDDPFVFDDESFIINNKMVHELRPITDYFTNSTMSSGGRESSDGIYFRPIVILVYASLWQIQNGDVFPFHVLQWLLFTLSCIIFFCILYKNMSFSVAAVMALIFLAHPLNSELVLYISDMPDVLCLFFGMASLYFSFNQQKFILASVLLLFSLLAKESGILFLIPLLWIISNHMLSNSNSNSNANSQRKTKDINGKQKIKLQTLKIQNFNRHDFKSLLFQWTTVGSFIVFYLFLRLYLFKSKTISHNAAPIAQLSFLDRLINIPKIVYYYLSQLLLMNPITLQQDGVVLSLNWTDFYWPLICCFVFILFVWSVWKSTKFIKNKILTVNFKFLGLYFIISGLLMHIQLVPLGATVASRWFIFSFAGILFLFGTLSEYLVIQRNWKWLGGIILVSVIPILSWLSYQRTQEWESGLKLFQIEQERQPDSYLMQNNYGVELFRQGHVVEALPYFQKSTELYPEWPTSWNNLGAVYQRMNRLDLAEKYYLKSVKGNYYLAFENYAGILYAQKRWSELKDFLQKEALVKFPMNSNIRNLLHSIPKE